MPRNGDQQKLRIRQFLDSLDLDKDSWKEEVVDYICAGKWENEKESEISEACAKEEKKRKRIATFSVGDDLEDEIEELVLDSLSSKEQKDAETQCVEEAISFEDSEIPIEELSKHWAKGQYVRPGDVLRLLNRNMAKSRDLENRFDQETAIAIRREFVSRQRNFAFKGFPYKGYDYKFVVNSCCENVIGYTPIPTGVAGPLTIKESHKETKEKPAESTTVFVPMATTEGALIASTNRGCSALSRAGGVVARITDDKMTRAPVIQFPRAGDAVDCKLWLEEEENYQQMKTAFEGTSRFCKLKKIEAKINGNTVYLKFCATTGDAMGMNMVTKACSAALHTLKTFFPQMKTLALSGNYCVDKKASATNWIVGRGKSVVVDAVLPARVVKDVLKTTPSKMAEVAQAKLSGGSAMAACIGGNNSHAANIVAAIFIATGQDAAQVVSSSMCQTEMSVKEDGSLYVACTMPCMEVGTVGGGTILPSQNECLKMLGCAGPSEGKAANAKFLAKIIASTVMAAELSLMAALCTDQLVSSHMRLNRSQLVLHDRPAMVEEKSQPSFTLAPHRTKRNSERASCSNIL